MYQQQNSLNSVQPRNDLFLVRHIKNVVYLFGLLAIPPFMVNEREIVPIHSFSLTYLAANRSHTEKHYIYAVRHPAGRDYTRQTYTIEYDHMSMLYIESQLRKSEQTE